MITNKPFIHENFLLETKTAEKLYHDFAKDMPIIDYHCHLDPEEIAIDQKWENITQVWLNGDHYKWRALRANGINEKYITGSGSDREKFDKWAETVPFTIRNPLYHWAHMELKKPFGITKLLDPSTADEIYTETGRQLQQEGFSAKSLMRKWKVEVVCTTDDPVDTLEYHKRIKEDNFEIKVLPAWRPDKVIAVEDPEIYNSYINKLSIVSGVEINNYNSLIEAINIRHDFFDLAGCRLSDHGLDRFYSDSYTEMELNTIFKKIMDGKILSSEEQRKIKSALLYELAVMDHEKGWVQQYHYGPIRNNNTRMFQKLGPDTGYDSMGDNNIAMELNRFLNKLEIDDRLAKTIIYNINPGDNDTIATAIANFQGGGIPGKIQLGSGWWFLDQRQGIEAQLNALSNHGLLSRFVGMLTDSRSFLSYCRHDYFRRVLCNLLGDEMEKGLIPDDIGLVGKMVRDISYNNAKEYFNF